MKFKAYLTSRIDCLHNEEYLGEFNTEEEAIKVALAAYKERGYHEEPYFRGLLFPQGTFFDAGSYNHFIAILFSE